LNKNFTFNIDEDEKETFNFEIKSSSDLPPGDYNIPYQLKYFDQNGSSVTKEGTFGISVSAKTELVYEILEEDNIVGSKGKIYLKIINQGLGDIGFVSVKVLSNSGLEILSSSQEYLGTIDSDDFESAEFETVFKQTNAQIIFQISYKDFENNDEIETITLPVKVYTQEKAIELGLLKKPNYGIYVILLVLVFAFFGWRKYKKKRKNKLKTI